MRCHDSRAFAVVIALCASGAVRADAAPSGIVGVGLMPGWTFSQANAVSADGQTVVGQSDLGAFRWTRAGGLVQLAGLPGESHVARAYGVSGTGLVIVGASGSSEGSAKPARWGPAGAAVALPIAASERGQAQGVSADGSAVVGWATVPAGQVIAAKWTAAGMQALPPLVAGREAQAMGTSADGGVVVGNGVASTDTFFRHAARWTTAGVTDLGVLPGGRDSYAMAVSADGATVAGFGSASAGGRAFRWTQGGGLQSLGVLPGSTESVAYAVSADGLTIGGYSVVGSDRAFLWKPSLGMVDLNTYAGQYGVDLTGWTLSQVRGISADGSVITGIGVQRVSPTEARFQGFVLTLPAPGSGLGLVTLGVLAARRRRRAPR